MTTPLLSLDELTQAQINKYITINEMARALEQGATRFSIIDKDLTTPPGGESDGDAYIVAAGGTAAWSGHDGEIALYESTAYKFVTPYEGLLAYAQDEGITYKYTSGAWAAASIESALLDNNQILQGKDTGGTARDLIGVDGSDDVQIGNSTLDTILNGLTIQANKAIDIISGGVSAGDIASIGYASTTGLQLTGQGSTYDVTLINDAGQWVCGVATGTQNMTFQGQVNQSITSATFQSLVTTDASNVAQISITGNGGTVAYGVYQDDFFIHAAGEHLFTAEGDYKIGSGGIIIGDTAFGDANTLLQITSGDSGVTTLDGAGDDFLIENSSHAGMSIISTSATQAAIYMGDSAGAAQGGYIYDNSDDSANIRAGNTNMVHVTNIGQTRPNDPAFLAYNSSTDTNQTGNGSNPTVDLDTEVHDQGNDFTADTFTASKTGKFQIDAHALVYNMTANSLTIQCRITTSNRTYIMEHIAGAVNSFTQFTVSISQLCDMDNGDTATFSLAVNGEGADTCHIYGHATILYTAMSGYLAT